jgi:FtsH-binding integral membrane protein
MYANSHYKPEEERFVYNKSSVRASFATKVFSIVAAQLVLTAAIIVACRSTELFSTIAEKFSILWIIGVLTTSVLLGFFRDLARKVPTNYTLLLIFTISESFLIHTSIQDTYSELVYLAMGLTGATVAFLAGLSYFIKADLTSGRFIGAFILSHLLLNLVGFFIMGSSIIIVYLSTLVFCAYLVFDMQMILGNRERALEVDEYIFGAINLYTDIVVLFMKILKILKSLEEKERKKSK